MCNPVPLNTSHPDVWPDIEVPPSTSIFTDSSVPASVDQNALDTAEAEIRSAAPAIKPTGYTRYLAANKGPYAVFDSLTGTLKVSGRISLLDSAVSRDVIVEVSRNRFFLQTAARFFGLTFSTTVRGAVSFIGGGSPAEYTIALEAKASGLEEIRLQVGKKLEEWKNEGIAAIKKAKAEVDKAKQEVDKAAEEVVAHKAAVSAEQRRMDSGCDGLRELQIRESKHNEIEDLQDALAVDHHARKLLASVLVQTGLRAKARGKERWGRMSNTGTRTGFTQPRNTCYIHSIPRIQPTGKGVEGSKGSLLQRLLTVG